MTEREGRVRHVESGVEFVELSEEAKDHELARHLQEQEAAMFHFYEQRQDSGEPEGQLLDPLDAAVKALLYSEDGGMEETDEADRDGTPETGEEGPEEEIGSGSESPAEQIDDAEFARRLHLQEQMDHHRRIMEMAGLQGNEDEEFSLEDEEIDDEEDPEEYFTDDSIDPDDLTYEELMAIGDTVGVVSKGLIPEAIQKLPQARYAHPSDRESDVRRIKGLVHRGCDKDEQCTICRMEFETRNLVKLLPCGHIFHPVCVDQWLAINKVCPNCGKEVGPSNECQNKTEQNSHPIEPLTKLS